jgi:sialate O-acetylesterase
MITHLHDFQVLQRDSDGRARAELASGEKVELEAGGPYEVDGAQQILVGDIWILAGQSNMEGVGDLTEIGPDGSPRVRADLEEPSPFVHSFQSREQWAIADEPLHWLHESPRPIHRKLWGGEPLVGEPDPRDPLRPKGAGLGLTFAKLWRRHTGVPVGLVPCAHGGTSMAQWSPMLRDEGGDSLYGATYLRFQAVGGKVAGILWYQGESDADAESITRYAERMKELVAALRHDFDQPNLPFYYVQIGRYITEDNPRSAAEWSAIRELQRTLVGQIPNSAMVAAIDLGLDDGIHIGTTDFKRLAKRLVDVASGIPAPDLAGVRLERDGQRIRVSFKNLRGGLRSNGRPSGFSLRSTDGKDLARIFNVVLEGDDAVICCDPIAEKGMHLYYGYGLDPYCNLTDAEDAAIPAFGPVVLE